MTEKSTEQLYDVVAVGIESSKVRILDTGKTKLNAEAFVKMAVFRRGLDEEFYTEVPAGKYKTGDKYESAN